MTFPTSGTVHILGEQMGRVDLAKLRRFIGHVNPRHRLQYSLTVREVVLTGITATIDTPMRWTPRADELTRADAMIAAVGLTHKADDVWPTLSQGERGRTLIARALISEPRLLLLDEPTTGLDVAAREQLLETIDSLDETHPEVASILVTHHLEELRDDRQRQRRLRTPRGGGLRRGPLDRTGEGHSLNRTVDLDIAATVVARPNSQPLAQKPRR